MKYQSIAAALALWSASAGLVLGANRAVAQTGQSDKTRYEIIDRLKIGGDSGWDFLAIDAKRHQLFVTRGDKVQVVDMASGKLLTTLTDFHCSHGVAIAEDVGFISSGKSNSVTAVDLNTLKPVEAVSVTGTAPDAILYEPTQKRVYTMNHKSGDITVLDAATRKVVDTIKALGALEVAVIDSKGKLFVNSEETSELAVIDLKSAKMEAHWPLGNCQGPTGLAIDTEHDRLFSVCANNKMVVVDAKSGKLVAELPIGGKPDGAAFDAGLGMAYSSNGDGSLTVVHEDDPDHFRVVENLPTQFGAWTMVLDPLTHRMYLSAALYGPMPAITAETPKPRAPVLPDSFNILVVAPRMDH